MNKTTLAFEIGTEEIPAFDLVAATKELDKKAHELLDEARVSYDSLKVYSTPRRLILLGEGLGLTTEALVEEHKGPSTAIAFNEAHEPTKAAIGFAQGKGIPVEDLEIRQVGDAEYVYAVKEIPAQNTADILVDLLQTLITTISWPKSMRWARLHDLFSRPVRWILALLDTQVIPVEFAGLVAGNVTWGHRVLSPGTHEVASADKLLEVLDACSIIPSFELREQRIKEAIARIENTVQAKAELPQKTLTEVVNLCEYPTPLLGTFDASFLEVPQEIIVDAMIVHQRYFPLYDLDGRLTNQFIVVSNGNPEFSHNIIDGNERVIRPRLADAKFFYEEDLKHPLAYYVDMLDKVVFQVTLGTMKDKTKRIEAIVAALCEEAHFDAQKTTDAKRAAYLCKADLVTNAVVEFTAVQGIMGAYYAQASGENGQVVEAIAEHYHPRFADDTPPRSDVGKVVAVADKLDTICGLFALNQGPTGSSDPFALRRSAIGVIKMLVEGLPISLTAALQSAFAALSNISFDRDAAESEVKSFFITRTKVMLRDEGFESDVIDAVLGSGIVEPALIVRRVKMLAATKKTAPETIADLAAAYGRAHNIRDEKLGDSVDTSLLQGPEVELYSAIESVGSQLETALAEDDYEHALQSLANLRTPVDAFFEEVRIMDDDRELRENRIRLLNRFVALFIPVADFGKLVKAGK